MRGVKGLPIEERIELYEQVMELREKTGWGKVRIGKFLGFSPGTIDRWLHGANPTRLWSEEELNILKELYLETPKDEIIRKLPNRTWYAINIKASLLGIKRNQSKFISERFNDPEYREKIREINKKSAPKRAKKISKTIQGKGNPFYGKHHTEETIRKIKENMPDMSGGKNSFYGKHHTEETKKKMRGPRPSVCGDKNPAWRGGYEPYYGPNWNQQRKNCLERDNHICRICGAKENGKGHNVHHIIPFREFGRERYTDANQLDNLITLCDKCHLEVEWGKLSVSGENA